MNHDLDNIVTPVKVNKLNELLLHYKYNDQERKFLIEGFTNGFEIGFEGDRNVRQKSPNLKLDVSSPEELWNKVMKEVKLLRFAGPFDSPFENFIQSPIGLVPKGSDGNDTSLIFHVFTLGMGFQLIQPHLAINVQ